MFLLSLNKIDFGTTNFGKRFVLCVKLEILRIFSVDLINESGQN